jgi:Na+-translocating ferredoxin:NAD+ oxidoreductase subunit B
MVNVYQRLRDRLDMFPQGFPRSKSGIELKILHDLFTPEEAEIALILRPFPEKAIAIAHRVGKDETKLQETLFDMSKRGLIMRYRAPDDQLYYWLIPWVIGIFEFQLNNLTRERVQLFEKYYEEAMVPAWRQAETLGFRVIPIEKEIEGNTTIQPYERVSEIIEANTVFAVADCICRKERAIVGEGCGKLLEACMVFGPAASYYVENGIGRAISKEEAKNILLKAEEEGLVHCSTNHASGKMFICNCCGCCCGLMRNVTKYDNPQVIIKSNYYAVNDARSCNACGTCVERCQVHAIRIDDDIAIIERDRCIGCGLCVSTCSTGSLSLTAKSPDETSHVFADEITRLQAVGKLTGKSYPFE